MFYHTTKALFFVLLKILCGVIVFCAVMTAMEYARCNKYEPVEKEIKKNERISNRR